MNILAAQLRPLKIFVFFSLSVHWNYRKVYLCHTGQSRFCNQAFFGTTETLTRPFLNNTSCRHRSSGRYLENKISNDVFPCVYFRAIINSQQRKKDSNMFNRSFISWQKLDSCHLPWQNTNVTTIQLALSKQSLFITLHGLC